MSLINTIKFIINHPLNKNNKINSLKRFFKWQIGSRLIPGEVLYHWINGAKMIIAPGETGLTGNIYCGLHEFSDMAYMLHILKKEDLFVDVGANSGSYTILAAAAVGAKVFSFEPVPSTYTRLLNNVHINNIENNVNCFNVAVGDKESYITLTTNIDTMNHVCLKHDEKDDIIQVKMVTLDSLLHSNIPSLIKIDVEGYETAVIEGASNVLENQKLHSIIIELNGSGNKYRYDEKLLVQKILDYGFRSFTYDPFKRKLSAINGKNLNSVNTLFIRNKEYVLETLEKSLTFSINDQNI